MAEDQTKPPDYKYSYEARYKLKKDGGDYLFAGKVNYHTKYLTDKSIKETTQYIYENQKQLIKKYEHRLNGRKLNKKWSHSFYPSGEDQFFREHRLITLAFPDSLEVGDETSVKYWIRPMGLEWFAYRILPNINWIESWEMAFEHPKDVRLEFEIYFPRDSIPYTITHPNEKQTVLLFDSVMGVADTLPLFRYNNSHAVILTRFYNEDGPINPCTDELFGRWYGNIRNPHPVLAPDQDSDLERALDSAGSDLDKLSIIHDFVRENVRYIADISRDHALKPKPASNTMTTRYGDCKDRAYLVRALAASQGIKVNMAAIHSQRDIPFQGIHASLFNHVINAYDSGDSIIFFDPTNRYAPFDQSVIYLENQTAIIADPDHPRRAIVPCQSKSVDLEIDIQASLDSVTSGIATIVLHNQMFVYAAEMNRKLSGAKLENGLEVLVTANFSKLGLDQFAVIDSSANSVTLTATADLSGMIINSPKRMYLVQNPFAVLSPKQFDRSNDPWELNHYSDSRLSLKIALYSAGYTAAPDTVSFGIADLESMASYEAVIENLSQDTLMVIYSLNDIFHGPDPPAKTAYLNFLKQLYENKTGMFPVEVIAK